MELLVVSALLLFLSISDCFSRDRLKGFFQQAEKS